MFQTQFSPAILPILAQIPTLFHAQWYRPICLAGTRSLPSGEHCQQSAGIDCLRSGCLPLYDWLPLSAGLLLFRHWASSFQLIVANSEYLRQQLNAWGCPSTLVMAPR